MPYEKLYFRVLCQSCDGTRLARDQYDPVNKRWGRCPYCGPSGKTYVSITVTALKKHIDLLDDEDFEELKAYIDEKTNQKRTL